MNITKLNSDLNSVYNLTGKINQLYSLVEEAEGEITDEQLKELDINKEEVIQIGKDCIQLTNLLSGQDDMLDKEIKRLQDLKAWRAKQVVNIEKALLYLLLSFGEQDKKGIYRLDLGIAILSTKRNPESVEIENESLVPNDYKKFDLLLKDLNSNQLEILYTVLRSDYIKNLFEEEKEDQITNDITKTTPKIVKKELKPVLQEIKDKVNKLKEDWAQDLITDDTYKTEIEALPDYGAKIKDGVLNLVIK